MAQVLFNQVVDFTGGLNFRADQFQLASNESPDMLNVEIDPRGGLFSRAGWQFKHTNPVNVGSAPWTPKGVYNFQGDTPTIMLTTGYTTSGSTTYVGGVFKSTGSDFTQLNYGVASANYNIPVNNTDGASFAQWDTTLYMVTGTSTSVAYKWETGNTYASTLAASGPTWQVYELPVGGFFPRANLAIVHANKMFVANTYENGVAYPNRLRWSHENSPENWFDDDYIDINAGGEGIRGIVVVDGQLLIFKPKAIYLLMGYDADNFQLVELSTILGIDYPQQAVAGDGGCYFFDYPKGLYFYDRNGIQDLFVRLRPILIDGEINVTALDKITVSFVNNRLWLSMPYAAAPTTPPAYAAVNFIFDRTISEIGAYTQFQSSGGYGLVSGTDWRDSSDNVFHLLIHPSVKFVCYVDDFDNTEDDNYVSASVVSQDFSSYYRTSWFDDNRYVQEKTFLGPDFVLKEVDAITEVRLNVYYDFDSTTQQRSQTIKLTPVTTGGLYGTGVYGTAVYGTDTVGASVYEGSPLGRARAVQLEFVGPTDALTDTAGREWGINSIAYKFKRRNIKG